MKSTKEIIKEIIRLDLPPDEYFKDELSPEPSLSQSLAKTLLEYSPRHAWLESPRLNPNFRADDDKKYDIGNIAHTLLIGRGKRIKVIEATDWRTNAAKEARDVAAAEGILAVLPKHVTQAREMVKAATLQVADMGLYKDFELSDGEVAIVWQQDQIWMRTMIDKLKDKRLIFDYKTTAASASPSAVARKMADDGWDIQAATHALALNAVDPDNAGRRTHLFICQENYPPYALTVAEMSEAVLTIGHKKLMVAMEIWQECMESDQWPMYPARIIRPEYPEWAENAWLKREMEGFKHEAI